MEHIIIDEVEMDGKHQISSSNLQIIFLLEINNTFSWIKKRWVIWNQQQ